VRFIDDAYNGFEVYYYVHNGSSVQISKKGNYGNFGNFGSNTSKGSVIPKNLLITEVSEISLTCTFGNFRNSFNLPNCQKQFSLRLLFLEISVISFFGNLNIPHIVI